MSASEFIKSIHALATLRHLDYDASQIGVVVKPLSGALYSGCKLAPPDLSRDVELSEACAWEAQVRLKGGDWGCFVGTGQTPDEALLSLLRSYEASHEAVDKRRAGVLGCWSGGGARRWPPRAARFRRGLAPPSAHGPDGVGSLVNRLEPTPEQKSFMSGYTAGAQSMGGLLDGVAAERAYHAQVALLDGLIAQLGAADSLKEAQLLVREARQALPLPNKK